MTDKRSFASTSLPRHLLRGATGFGALIGAFALLPVLGPGSLLLAPIGLLALRGCPACWAIGLVQTVSMGRLQRSCKDGVCELTVARPASHQHSESRPGDSGVPVAH
ncbi:hypothetical protein AB0C69_13580 [Actinomadura sp. NPDC048032]|uniref:hypothetical protein n=1 Tax=Actinomadura sp. NPDC048032 TaxID=3155747 RepID=UPI0033F6417C